MSTPALAIHQPEAADARSLADQAYYRIRELIVTLELPPGSLVSERELMERLGVGRTPVREALRTLARERLVDVYPRRGMFVSRRRRARPGRALGGAAHAREPRRAARRRARDGRRPSRDRTRCSQELEAIAASARRADADRPRPADPPPRLRVRAQPVPRGDAERVLRAHAADLVPRARPGRPPRGRRPASTASCSRRSGTATPTEPRTAMRRTSRASSTRSGASSESYIFLTPYSYISRSATR